MSAFQKYRYNNLLVNTKDYVMIVVGLMIYAIGFTACILPHKVVMGGLTGVGTLVYFATDGAVSVAVTSLRVQPAASRHGLQDSGPHVRAPHHIQRHRNRP